MLKKLILVFIIIIFFISGHLAYGALVINEVMYDLSGSDSTSSKSREWIEIYNNGTSAVDIDASVWRIYDGTANRTINGEVSFSIGAGAFIILAGDKDTFLADHSGFSGVIYDTGITTLSNTGALLKLLDQDGSIVDSFSYTSSQGGAGDGNTLQKISGSWTGAVPTPGVANETTTTNTDNGSSSGSSTGGSSTTSSNTNEVVLVKKEQKIQTKILSKNIVFSGIPLEFKASVTGRYGETLPYGKYFWNFGDGDSKELRVGEVDKFSHTYFYPGEYSVVLEYCMTYCEGEPDAFDKISIKVLEPQVIISSVGEGQDFYIELENKGDYDADISRWVLLSNRKDFIFPRNTVLGPKKYMRVSPNVSGFLFADKESLVLMNSQREMVYDYVASLNKEKNITPVDGTKVDKKSGDNFNLSEKIPEKEINNKISPTDLNASAIIADTGSNNYRPYIFSGILLVFLGVTSISVYFIRRRRVEMTPGDDFELLDE